MVLNHHTGVSISCQPEVGFQGRISQQMFKTFSSTKDFVHEGDTLELYQTELLIIGEDHIRYLVLQ